MDTKIFDIFMIIIPVLGFGTFIIFAIIAFIHQRKLRKNMYEGIKRSAEIAKESKEKLNPKKCEYCGTEIDVSDKKCPNCGAPVKK